MSHKTLPFLSILTIFFLCISAYPGMAQSGTEEPPINEFPDSGTVPTPIPGSEEKIIPETLNRTGKPLRLQKEEAVNSVGEIYAVCPSALYILDPATGDATFIGMTGYSNIYDVAFVGERLFGVAGTDLLSIDPLTGQASRIGSIGYTVNALVGSPGGTLFGATGNGQLLTINQSSGSGSLVGNLPYLVSGDLAYLDGYMYGVVTSDTDWLMAIDEYDASAQIVSNIGYAKVFGLTDYNGYLYAGTDNGDFLRLDPDNGFQVTHLGNNGIHITGLTTGQVYGLNDDFDDPYWLTEPPANGLSNQILDTEAAASSVSWDDPDMGCGWGTNYNTLWFAITPSFYGTLRLRTFNDLDPNANSDYDTVLAAFTGQRGALELLDCNDDTSGVLSEIFLFVEPGKTYYIEVASYDELSYGGILSLFYNYDIQAPKEWTLMFYTAGDSDEDQENRLWDQYLELQDAKMNLYANVVGLWEDTTDYGYYDYFSPWGWYWEEMGEMNTGNPNTLKDFIDWSVTNFPADHYALIISDHGHGSSGSAYDYNNGNSLFGDMLSPQELRSVLVDPTTPYLDILYMDACLMGTLDSGYQLRNTVGYYVASESVTFGSIIPEWFINGQDSIPYIGYWTSPVDLATAMALSYANSHNFPNAPSTISVVDISEVYDLAFYASNLAGELRSRMDLNLVLTLENVRKDVQHFEENSDNVIDHKDRIIDLYHFASLVQSRFSIPELDSAAADLMTAIDYYVVFEQHWNGTVKGNQWKHGDSHGVSAIFPEPLKLACYYTGLWLDFANGSFWGCSSGQSQIASSLPTYEWGPMLVEFTRQMNPYATEDLNPPDPIPPYEPGSTTNQIFLPLMVR